MTSNRPGVELSMPVSGGFEKGIGIASELTKQDNRYCDQYHEHMMVTQERNQPLDSNSEPYVRHRGRNGLPAVWWMGREIKLRPSGTGGVVGEECARAGGVVSLLFLSGKECSMFLGMLDRSSSKNGRLWRRCLTVIEDWESAWLLVEVGSRFVSAATGLRMSEQRCTFRCVSRGSGRGRLSLRDFQCCTDTQ